MFNTDLLLLLLLLDLYHLLRCICVSIRCNAPCCHHHHLAPTLFLLLAPYCLQSISDVICSLGEIRAFRIWLRLAREHYKTIPSSSDFGRTAPSSCAALPRNCISWSQRGNQDNNCNNRLNYISHS